MIGWKQPQPVSWPFDALILIGEKNEFSFIYKKPTKWEFISDTALEGLVQVVKGSR